MKNFRHMIALTALLTILGFTTAALAQTTVTLTDTSQSTTFTATVSEQITVTVPSAIAWTVADVTSSTAAAGAAVTVTAIALTDGNHLKISLAPDATSFTGPVAGTTWASSDVSWNASTGTAWTGAANSMSALAGTYVEIASCTVNVSACDTSDLVFTLAAKSSVNKAGAHTLAATWKSESLL